MNVPRRALNPFGGREVGNSSTTRLGKLASKYKRASVGTGTNRVSRAGGYPASSATTCPCGHYLPAEHLCRDRAPHACRGEAASLAPCCPLAPHGQGQPCPPGHAAPGLGAGRGLSQEPDGAVTLGSSGQSPRPTDLVRHLPLPRAWERLCSPAARPRRAVCATAGKGTHSSWP